MMQIRSIALILFVLLNLADLVLSSYLFSSHSQWAREGNPVANWFFSHWGFVGLGGFKCVMVGFTILILLRLQRLRPVVAQALTGVGCAIVLGVVIYSAHLIVDLNGHSAYMARQHEVKASLSTRLAASARRQELIVEIGSRIIEGNLSLAEGALALEAEMASDQIWIDQLRSTYGPCSALQRFAFILCLHLETRLTEGSSKSVELLSDLDRQLQDIAASTGSAQTGSSVGAAARSWERFKVCRWVPLLRKYGVAGGSEDYSPVALLSPEQ